MNRQISVLAAIAIFAIGLGVWLYQAPSKDTFTARLLFDDLQKFANQIDSVEIENAQGMLFSAQKLDKGWLATFEAEQFSYPVSQDKLADFVETMMYTKLLEAKTRKSENYARLGLQPIDNDDSMANLVTFKTTDKSWQVLVGNKVSLGEGQYILKPENSQSWRTDKTISLPIDKFSWLKQPILPYQAQEISSIARIDDIDWQIVRAANGDFQLIDMPKGKQLEYASILNSIVNNLTSLSFEELITPDENFAQSLKVLTQLEVSTLENDIFQVEVSERDDKHFVYFRSTDQSEYWQTRYYQVSNFSAQQLIKTLDDFLVQESSAASDTETKSQIIEEGDSPF